jgi:hypothetical protein
LVSVQRHLNGETRIPIKRMISENKDTVSSNFMSLIKLIWRDSKEFKG